MTKSYPYRIARFGPNSGLGDRWLHDVETATLRQKHAIDDDVGLLVTLNLTALHVTIIYYSNYYNNGISLITILVTITTIRTMITITTTIAIVHSARPSITTWWPTFSRFSTKTSY